MTCGVRSLSGLILSLAHTAGAGADYTLRPLIGGVSFAAVLPGESVALDIMLEGGPGDVHNSAVFQVVCSEPGLLYESYAWSDPYTTGTIYDDCAPFISELPLAIDGDVLQGPGYPDGVVDLELSNVLITEEFGVGLLVTLHLRVPEDWSGDGPIFLLAVPDTFADGFLEIPTSGAGGVEVVVTVPEDINRNGVVEVQDLVAVVLAWGVCTGDCPADLNGDGMVSVSDLVAVILAWE
jgi:hypothetical protein